MGALRAPARALRDALRRIRFGLWALKLRLRLRVMGARLVLEAPHGARLTEPPRLRLLDLGDGDATLTIRFGRGVSIGRLCTLDVHVGGTNVLSMDDDAHVLDGVRVQLWGGEIRMGKRVNIRDRVLLKSSGRLLIGDDVPVSNGSMLQCSERIELAATCGIAERVTIIDSDHRPDGSDTWFLAQPIDVDPVTIAANVFVSANAVVLRGSHVGANSVVAANAVLTGGDYPSGWVIAGLPGRPVKRLGKAAAGSVA